MSTARERGIVFSGPMVLALLAGRKTVTRRLKCNYRIGDRLYVRETWRAMVDDSLLDCVEYRADGSRIKPDGLSENEGFRFDAECDEEAAMEALAGTVRWRPSMFMPKWAARPWRGEVTDIREEHVQDITEEQAIAEGVTWSKYDDFEAITVGFDEDGNFPATSGKPVTQKRTSGPARIAFYELWNSLYGPEAWAANPVVYAISFKALEAETLTQTKLRLAQELIDGLAGGKEKE